MSYGFSHTELSTDSLLLKISFSHGFLGACRDYVCYENPGRHLRHDR